MYDTEQKESLCKCTVMQFALFLKYVVPTQFLLTRSLSALEWVSLDT